MAIVFVTTDSVTSLHPMYRMDNRKRQTLPRACAVVLIRRHLYLLNVGYSRLRTNMTPSTKREVRNRGGLSRGRR